MNAILKRKNRHPYALLAAASLAAFGVLVATTGDALAAEPAGMTATTNVNLVTQYRFRGIDQTWGRPALQGGADLAWRSGFYAGLWASNVSANSYAGGHLEVDYYAGYNGKIGDDVGWTVGGYGYWYPGANFSKAACPSAAFAAPCTLPSQKFDTFELNAGLSWQMLSYKLSVAATDYFGANASTGYSKRTRGTMYHDVTLTWPLADDLSLVGHVGYTDVKASYGALNPDYADWRIAVAKTFGGGWSASAAVVGASNNAFFRPPTGGLSMANGDTRELNKPMLVLQAGRSF